MIPEIHIEDYTYDLPEERIAKYPLERRDSSKLLVYKDGGISESVFRNLPSFLPADSIMVFNNTKVVPARLFFRRATGALIEIFCLEPVEPADYAVAFAQTESCKWKCVLGNAKRWKGDILDYYSDELSYLHFRARLIDRDGQTGTVEFRWDDDEPFSSVLETCGTMPIPPYLNRETEEIDIDRYQTLYAQIRGSVAAPTSGLHFTEEVLSDLSSMGIDCEDICLHVGAGTFLPVKSSLISEHTMHREPFAVSRSFILDLLESGKKVIAVGTTSVRTLESLYYAGVSIIETGVPQDVTQWAPYEREYPYSTEESLRAIVDYLEREGLDELRVGTHIIIVPGFNFRIVNMLITNFHQPQSTLLLLISAFVGGEWPKIYEYALGHGFRFLSYGDSSLLFRRG